MGIASRLKRADMPDRSTQSMVSLRRREALVAYLFIAPTFIGFLVFVAGPMVYSLGLSFLKWNIFQPAEFVGLENYVKLASDARFFISLKNTIIFTLLVVSLDITIALSLAVALQQKMPPV
jgi:multiple sugar transport system permease protein